jgi:hypothetical protein
MPPSGGQPLHPIQLCKSAVPLSATLARSRPYRKPGASSTSEDCRVGWLGTSIYEQDQVYSTLP